ncbi:MAG TPA: hypothetical protein VNA25_14155 [Phycisphaerae bacterium]|nr:hypothetical protein [Phycisphaerae bacterium]
MTTNTIARRVLNLLEANAGVAAIAGTNIYTPNFPDAPTLPGIVFFPSDRIGGGGGRSLSNIGFRAIPIHTQCYQDSSENADLLHEAIRTAFLGDFTDQAAHQALLRTFDISLIQEEQEGQPWPVDPDGPNKGTPVTLGFWTVWFLD